MSKKKRAAALKKIADTNTRTSNGIAFEYLSRSPLARYSDLIAAAIYFVVLFGLLLPWIKYNYDYMHHANLLMSSVRILEGQVPFRDFFPWYGPLYHYFLAGWVFLLGRDLLAVKIFLIVVSPVLSMAMLIAALRLMNIGWSGRLFAVCTSALWGMDRLVHCGSTRSLLGLLLIALWTRGISTGRPRRIRGLVMPSVLLAFFYSPDVGAYLLPSAAVFMIIDLMQMPGGERRISLLDYGAGLVASLLVITGLYYGTSFTRNYLHFFKYTSSNMAWAYGLPFQPFADIVKDPRYLYYFLPLIASVAGTVVTAMRLWQGRMKDLPLWLPVCIMYSLALWSTTYIRTDPDHLLFALPPAMVMMARLFEVHRTYHIHKLILPLLIIVGQPVFYNSSPDTSKEKSLKSQVEKENFDCRVAGVYFDPLRAKMVSEMRQFIKEHPQDKFIFPLQSFEAFQAGQPLTLPEDDFFWANEPEHKSRIMEAIIKADARFLVYDYNYQFWVYGPEDTDEFYDYVLSNYEPLLSFHSTVVYQRRSSPRNLATLKKELPVPITLDRGNGFSVEWDIASSGQPGFVQLEQEFFYRPAFLQRFSKPEVRLYLDGKLAKRNWDEGEGRARLRTTRRGGSYRIFYPAGTGKIKMVVEFYGILNAAPERVVIDKANVYEFDFRPAASYTTHFMSLGY